MKLLQATLVMTALLVGTTGRAHAAQTISSPLVLWTGQLGCYVRNVGATPITVNVQLIAIDGTAITPTFEDCNAAALAGGATCVVLASPATTAWAACSATASRSAKNLRGTLELRYGLSANVRVAGELW
jgi:hypothetical protein